MLTTSRAFLACLLASCSCVPALGEDRPDVHSAAAALGVRQIVAHRGSSADRPENTLASVRRAMEVRATAVEVDVRRSSDGKLVLRHDDTLDRTTNGKGPVNEKTLAELGELDAGSWFDAKFKGEKIPTLQDVLTVCRGKIDVLLDLKESGAEFERLVAAQVQKHGEENRTILGVRSLEQARTLRALLPKARQIGLIAAPDEIEAYAEAGCETIRLWPKWLADKTLAARVSKANAALHLNGTLGSTEEILPLLAYRPDSLSADDPAQLLATLAQLAADGSQKALSPLEGELSIEGLRDKVEVARDRSGVAHIYARNADDLFFAQGFCAAQDRLFQLDMWRRQAVGELAEVLGPSALEADSFARLIRYRGDMEAEWQSYSPDTKAIATAFTRGINACILQMGDRLPIEFQTLGFRPKPWKPEDILGRASGIYMTQNFRNEVQRLKLIQLVGFERARRLAPIEPERDYSLFLSPEQVRHFPEAVLQGYEALTKTLSFTPPKTESNNWVLSGERSRSGKPLLASDPHRAIALPSLRYMVHLSAPGWNVIGAGEPGLPGVAIGHNDRIAWGFTIVGADSADLFVLELNAENPEQYRLAGRWETFVAFEEAIFVKGQSAPRKVLIRHSQYGPILFVDAERRWAYALKWPGSEPGGAAYLASLAVDRAQNEREFKEALSRWRVPGLNFVYADVEGNIGWIAAARYPLRSGQERGNTGLLPVPGNGDFDWRRYLAIEEYPQLANPPEGVLTTANHNIIPPGYRHPIGSEFGASYRYRRLKQLLSTRQQWGLGELRALQQDSFSLPGQELAAVLRQVGPPAGQRDAYETLANWNGSLAIEEQAGPLYALWLKELQDALFARHMPREQVKILNSLAGVSMLIHVLRNPDEEWFGNDPLAERDRLVRSTLEQAAEKWRQLPTEQQNRWGALHTVTFRHPLGAFGPAHAQVLNVGPFERPGEAHSPNNTRFDETFQQVHGATYRQLFDLADWDRGLATSAPGQSGQPGSPHYRDLAEGWAKGEYFPLVFSRERVKLETRHRLWLKPK